MNARQPDDDVYGYTFGPFRLDLTSYTLRRGGELLAITPKAFDTLVVLIKHRDRVVGKDELMSSLWPESFVSDDSLTQNISILRRALGDDPNQPQFIATAARHGYRFVGPIEVIQVDPMEATIVPPAPRARVAAAGQPSPPGTSDAPTGSRENRRSLRMWIALPVAFAGLLAAFVAIRTQVVAPAPLPERGPLRFTQEAPAGTVLISSGALSPDGRYLAFIAQDARSGSNQIWIRALDAAEAKALPGTEGAARPFWAPDSRHLGFFASGKVRQVGLDSQPSRAIAATDSTTEGGGSWSTKGVILFTRLRSGLYSVPAEGGPVTPVTTLDPSTQDVSHRWPNFLPDGRHFLFYVESVRPERAGTYLASLDSPDRKRLIDSVATYAAPGYILYIREGSLTVQPVDTSQGRLTGSPTTVATGALPPSTTNGAEISAADGLMAFEESKLAERLEWFNRSGQRMGTLDAPTTLRNPTVSPDGRQLLAASNADPDHKGLWVIELERGAVTRIASDGMRPFWSPDATRIAFTSDRAAGIADLYLRSITGRDGEETALLRTGENKFICDWSRDGRYLVYGSISASTKADLWLLPTSGEPRPIPYLQTPSNEVAAQISPDGRWLAYTSDESGRWEVYLQSFPLAGAKQSVSIGGGIEPHWRGDGRELFYLAADRNLMAVNLTPEGGSIKPDRPRVLFRAPVPSLNVFINWYAATPDGQRFVINTTAGKGNTQSVTVLVNWNARLKP